MSKLDELKQLSSYLRKTGFDADAKNVDAAIEHVEELEAETQRLWDLARHCRYELHRDDLITDDEYVTLAQNRDAVHRLEDYDAYRKLYDASRKLIERLHRRIDKLRDAERLSAKRIEELEAELKPLRELRQMVIDKSHEAGNDAGLAARYLTEIYAKASEALPQTEPK